MNIWDYEKLTPVDPINPVQLAAINQQWTELAWQLGIACLIIGFIIGILAGYMYGKNSGE